VIFGESNKVGRGQVGNLEKDKKRQLGERDMGEEKGRHKSMLRGRRIQWESNRQRLKEEGTGTRVGARKSSKSPDKQSGVTTRADQAKFGKKGF